MDLVSSVTDRICGSATCSMGHKSEKVNEKINDIFLFTIDDLMTIVFTLHRGCPKSPKILMYF